MTEVDQSETGIAPASETSPEKKSDFRSDIAGLRGVAVLLVLLCHFQIPGFSGGFIGPDIFFVISGYLITGLLVKEYALSIAARSRGRTDSTSATAKSRKSRRGKISLVNFYLRRARRILPAALLVIVAINAYAIVFLNVLQAEKIKSDSFWTLLFLANINFLRQATDYFAQGNSVSPLQHFWTLAVEEQFYLVWPVLFIAATRLNGLQVFGRKIKWRTRTLIVISLFGILSAGWMLIEFTTNPNSAYFSTFSRAWELALGGALGILSAEVSGKTRLLSSPATRLLALGTILGSIFLVTPDNFGYTLFVPVLATGILLIGGAESTTDIASRILSNRALLGVGAISYSLYLWHWPVYIFGLNRGIMDSLQERILGIVICFVLSLFSYRFVEQVFMRVPLPKGNKKSIQRKSGKTFYIPATVAGLLLGFIWVLTYSGINFGSGGVQAPTWTPPISQSSPDPNSSESGTSASGQWKYLEQSATKISSGQQLASPEQMPKLLANMTDIHDMEGGWKCSQPQNRLFNCTLGSPDAKNVWIGAGDSHLEMWKAGLRNLLKSRSDLRIELFIVVHCANSLDKAGIAFGGSKDDQAACMPMHELFVKRVAEVKPQLVILSDNSVPDNLVPAYSIGLKNMISAVKKPAENVLIISQTPKYPMLDRCLNKNLSNINSCSGEPGSISARRQAQHSAATQANIKIWDPIPFLCLDNVCPALLNEKLVSKDGTHIDPSLGIDLLQELNGYITELLG